MNHKNNVGQLLGKWRLDPSDEAACRIYGDVTLNFQSDGTLLYTIRQADKTEVIRLKFRVENRFIITDQPSDPRLEKTAYEITADGKLVLVFGDEKSRYVRVM